MLLALFFAHGGSWMNVLWMALFAAIIFGEKVWIRGGRWVARGAGIGFLILGVSSIFGMIEIPTVDMTMTDMTGSNKDMWMKNEMNQETRIKLREGQDDTQMDMAMNMNSS